MRLLKRAKLFCSHHFNVVDQDGTFICEVDFAFPRQRVIVEFDGWKFHWNREAFDKRSDVLQRLAALGWRLLPVTWTDLRKRPAVVIKRIGQALSVPPQRG